jgi:hypothetical protein
MWSADNGKKWKELTPDAEGTSWIWDVPPRGKDVKKALVKMIARDDATKVGTDKSNKPFKVGLVEVAMSNGREKQQGGRRAPSSGKAILRPKKRPGRRSI